MKKIKSIFKHIPGYRSGNRINEIIATIYYLFFIILLIVNLALGSINMGIIQLCFSGLTFPFIIFLLMNISQRK